MAINWNYLRKSLEVEPANPYAAIARESEIGPPPSTEEVDRLICRAFIRRYDPPTDDEWDLLNRYIISISARLLTTTWKYEVDHWRGKLDELDAIRAEWASWRKDGATPTAADAPPGADYPPPPPDDPLSDRAQLVLLTLRNRNAVDSDGRLTTADVVAETGDSDPVQYKAVISDLRERGYVNTKEGRGGGVWLTTKGQARASKL